MLIFNKDKITSSLVMFFVITALMTIYLIVQILRSDIRGEIKAKQDILAKTMVEYEEVRSEISNYESKIRALSPETIDKDYLEEQARAKLLYSKKNEVVIFRDQK